jgi:hypothetical protein
VSERQVSSPLVQPSTAAGRALLDNHIYWGEWYQHNWLAAILAIEAEAAAPYREALENARIVAEYWRDEMMASEGALRACSHPLACVIGALDGETNPIEMGTPPDEFERRRALLRREVGP